MIKPYKHQELAAQAAMRLLEEQPAEPLEDYAPDSLLSRLIATYPDPDSDDLPIDHDLYGDEF